MIEVYKINEVYVQFQKIDISTALELKEFFSFYVDNYWFSPKYKAKIWDGKISLFNWQQHTLPIGLLNQFIKFCEQFNYEYHFNFQKEEFINEISDDDFEKFYDMIFCNSTYSPRDYQDDCIKKSLRKKRGIIESPTGSGKSLSIYTIIRFLLGTCEGKILMIVPNINLVNQFFNDCKDYGWEHAESHCSLVFHNSKKMNWNLPIIISTWQSLIKKDENFFQQFQAVVVDECHQSDNNSINKVLKNCINEKQIIYIVHGDVFGQSFESTFYRV
jgi:reverse gyrase